MVVLVGPSFFTLGRRTLGALLAALLCAQVLPMAAAAAEYDATYTVATAPATMSAATATTVPVEVKNTGTATWNASGANPVHLAYHWYDPNGGVVVWDGMRTALPTNVAPNDPAVVVNAQVRAPDRCGTFHLRFALVKELVAWFPQEATPHAVTAQPSTVPAYGASFGTITPPVLPAGTTVAVNVPVTNCGSSTWTATGSNPVNLAYHWYDAHGRLLVWDGRRTSIGTDMAAGAAKTIGASVQLPTSPGTYVLAFEMVREGVAWLGFPARLTVNVSAALGAEYTVGATSPVSGFTSETKQIAVTVKNTGTATWNASGANPVHLSYHWYTTDNRVVVWDGLRTSLPGDVGPSVEKAVQLTVLAPGSPGTYVLKVDLVKEGVTWFSTAGVAPASLTFNVAVGYGASYAANGPGSIMTNAYFDTIATVTNTGQRTWPKGGPNPVHLSYHWFDSSNSPVLWDGHRGVLPNDVGPGQSAQVWIRVQAPPLAGAMTLAWDLVHEGVTWFSGKGVTMDRDAATVVHGVTFYGKGWGHGVGLSQWGAQGWAQGAVDGQKLNGEQIVQKYYPGATIATTTDPEWRILLSSPSTGCNARTIGSLARMISDGGIKVTTYADQNTVKINVPPGQWVRVWADNDFHVQLEGTTQHIIAYEALALTPLDPTKHITVEQKGRYYRGVLSFQQSAPSQLRVLNHVTPDQYVRGSLPTEMPTMFNWEYEAFRAQSYAARTYAAFKHNERRNAPFDLYDDTKDQCYGGASVETAFTDNAAASTSGKILMHNGTAINAYYSSSNGGSTESDGCVWGLVRTNGSYACGSSAPYLPAGTSDPADLKASDSRGPQPHSFWWKSFTAQEMRDIVRNATGVDIGVFHSVDLSNRSPSGRAISVKVKGTLATVELRGDSFLRTTLGMKSTFVRLNPF